MHSSVTFIKRLISICFQLLQHRFVDWIKPSNTSLTLGTVTDLVRTKSELVAENALLRQQLVILRRQVKRPVCAKTDRMLLVLLVRMVRTWKQALFIVQPETLLRWHRQGCAAVLEVQIQSSIFQTKDLRRDRGIDQGNGGAESALGSGTDPRRITQAGASCQQTHNPEVHATGAYDSTRWTELEGLPVQSCQRDLGLRLSPSH